MYNLEISADAIRQELDPVELKLANLKLAGQVLDADDKPVAGSYVNLNGDGQPNANVRARTAKGDSFSSTSAKDRLKSPPTTGIPTATSQPKAATPMSFCGWARLTVPRPARQTHKLKGTVTDADGQPAAGALVAVFPNNGTRWVKTGTKGEFNLTWSLQPWQAQAGDALLVVREPPAIWRRPRSCRRTPPIST